MKHTFKAASAALGFALCLAGTALAGPLEDGMDAVKRGDHETATRLLRPLADQGDARARLVLDGTLSLQDANRTAPAEWPRGGATAPIFLGSNDSRSAPSPSGTSNTWLRPILTALFFMAAMGIAYVYQMHKLRTGPERRAAARARLLASIPPEELAEIERANTVARERPWEPITFDLDLIDMMDGGFNFRAAGFHRGRTFGFAMAFKMHHGPVALCEWSSVGPASEALLDVLADYADVPRADSRFDELVKTSAIILQAVPPKVPFAQLKQLYCKVFFELAEDQPEIYLNFDFASKTGQIAEKDPMYRKSLVHAFRDRVEVHG